MPSIDTIQLAYLDGADAIRARYSGTTTNDVSPEILLEASIEYERFVRLAHVLRRLAQSDARRAQSVYSELAGHASPAPEGPHGARRSTQDQQDR